MSRQATVNDALNPVTIDQEAILAAKPECASVEYVCVAEVHAAVAEPEGERFGGLLSQSRRVERALETRECS
jgi:hypothetical protein